jgi:20S proteasome alpha/beta subunit
MNINQILVKQAFLEQILRYRAMYGDDCTWEGLAQAVSQSLRQSKSDLPLIAKPIFHYNTESEDVKLSERLLT